MYFFNGCRSQKLNPSGQIRPTVVLGQPIKHFERQSRLLLFKVGCKTFWGPSSKNFVDCFLFWWWALLILSYMASFGLGPCSYLEKLHLEWEISKKKIEKKDWHFLQKLQKNLIDPKSLRACLLHVLLAK